MKRVRPILFLFPLFISAWAASAVGTASASSPASTLTPVTFESYWTQVERSNPQLQSFKSQADQIRARVALPLPAPMIAVGSMGVRGPLSGVMEQTYEISQKIPFPSKFSAASSMQEGQVREKELESRTRILDLKRKLHDAFVDLSAALQEKELVREKQAFFSGHLKRLRAYSVSDQLQQLHILEMEAEEKSLTGEIAQLEGQVHRLRIQLNSQLGSEATTDHVPLLVPLNEPLDFSTPPGTSPSISRQDTETPALKLARAKEEVSLYELSAVRKYWLPDFSLTYRRRVRKDGVMDSSHEAVVGIELPFIWGQTSAQGKETLFKSTEARFQAEQQALDSRAEVVSLESTLESTREQLKLMQKDILPNLEKRSHLLHRLAQTDMESLDLHRSIYEQVILGRLKNLRLETEYRKSLFALEILKGSDP